MSRVIHLEFETATARIYRQRGRVIYISKRVNATLVAFAYRAEQTLAETACVRFNAPTSSTPPGG